MSSEIDPDHESPMEHERIRGYLTFIFVAGFCVTLAANAQKPFAVQNASGIRLVVASGNTYPTLRIIIPGHPDSDKAIEMIFPEHVTVRARGNAEGKHLFLFRPGQQRDTPAWRPDGQSLQYEKDFEVGLHMLARARLEEDGVRFRYEFVNRSWLMK